MTRRAFLRCGVLTATVGVAGLVTACGGGTAPPAARGPAGASAVTSATSTAAAAKAGGTLISAIFADPLTMDPALVGNPEGRGTTRAIHSRLLSVNEQGRLVPELAVSWEQPDPRTWVLHLREGVKFHDGTAFDAEAVKVNLERTLDPATKSIRAGEISTIDKVEVVDAKTVKLLLKAPFAAFLFPLSDVAGCMCSPTALQRWGQDYGTHPAGAGPFKFVEYQKDNRTVLERNPDYWEKGKPHLEQLILRPIPVDSSRLAELRSGGVHIAEALPFQDVQRLRQMPDIVVSEKPGFRWEYFAFNVRPKFPGANQKFRQAFQWAIDRQALHEAVYFGTGAVAEDGILPGSPFFDGNYKPFTYDMDRAKRLLDESKVPLPTTLQSTLQPDPVKQRAGQIFQATAEKLGIKVEIHTADKAERGVHLTQGLDGVDLDGWWGYRPDPDQYLYTLLHTKGAYAGYYGYSNPDMDRLLEGERAATKEEERRTIFRQIAQLQNENSPYVTWHYGSDFKGLSPRVKGFTHYQDSLVFYQDLSLS